MIPRLLLIIAFSLPMAALAQGLEPSSDSTHARLQMLLSGYEYSPTQAELEELGLDLQTALIDLAEDNTLPQLARGRAMNMLQNYPSKVTRAHVEKALADEVGANLYLLGRELQLATSFATTQPEWALDQIERFVAHEDVGVRTLTVQGLAVLRNHDLVRGRIDELLLQLSLGERNDTVKTALRDAIGDTPLVPTGRVAIRKLEQH
ncbi:MAG: hypothetical protein AUK47_04955 [Deltaproteobacteria bacterium CG2_30_63_29]|nr:MAG: hypothetical protein AUK47_04955 [Deltaproteobacteria bacterium CG2_30_63_29]PIW01198.1 MAG: hypothetical protein COW42_05670 [Deltaproteobacteria bacterium CG17_big_fil_post_rev_8_21_14_2_50_63_7]PJB47361.1 MAG: hypothetical protein CO108_04275 [Deltaproteobacteria bacterium CG_4_9_14_3_um_filter_63_12]